MQYLPNDGLYVYFRYDAGQTVMCVMNTSAKDKAVDLNDYSERTKGFAGGRNIVTNENVKNSFSIPAKRSQIIELTR